MNDSAIIVGGGIAGIFSALLYAKKGYTVTLIEKESELGGLLRSQNLYSENFFFDYGTHLLAETGIEEADQLLFDGLDVTKFDYLKTGSFYKGLYHKNGFLSDQNVEDKEAYLNELLAIKTPDIDKDTNLEQFFINRFGRGYTENILKPVAKKFFGTSAEELDTNAHKLFGLSRIIVGEEEQCRKLKQNPEFDSSLAFHSYLDGIPSQKSMYPNKNGVGQWIAFLTQKLRSANVRILCGVNIDEINFSDNKVNSVQVNDEVITVDKLVWTIPPFFLLHLCGLPIPSSPPIRLTSSIFHYVVDQDYLTDVYYFSCFDPDYKTFRVTLYDNYMPAFKDKKKISVEVLTKAPPADATLMEQEIFEELIRMGVIPNDTQMLFSANQIYPNGFPVLTSDFVENSKRQCDIATKEIQNVSIFGKANGRTWFMNEIICDIYNKVSEK